MSRCLSAAEIKGVHKARQDTPREGSKIRELYNLFQANRGAPVDYSCKLGNYMQIDQLRDVYGLDIRNVGYRRWLLAGEWFGKVYVDYVAERLEQT